MSTTVYIVRHAQSVKDQGSESTRPLSNEGVIASKKLVHYFLDKNIKQVISSPYTRAVQTVKPLAKKLNLNIEIIGDLRECEFVADNQILSDSEVYPLVEKMFADENFSQAGAESFSQCQSRAFKTFYTLLGDYQNSNIVLCSHGFLIMSLCNYFDKSYDFESLKKSSKPDLYELTFDDEKLKEISRINNLNI
ncbi:histidine phosphatase family protein [Floricoccus penangensis]|uniref:histidine phosphatase family protein n=1 Tax=Floricoccus penangensis TaxID=1859475 RepID=UPI00203ACF0F|nr:histidine phosphatase family protein [Floricoccus penangensis]URZ87869.1 phosphoglycerate mutase family protein [Floricoccus penangensis]